MNTAPFIQHAHALVTLGWTQETLARTASGDETDPRDPNATEWCAIGAMECAIGHLASPERELMFLDLLSMVTAHPAFARYLPEIPDYLDRRTAIMHLNDHCTTTQETILQILGDTIDAESPLALLPDEARKRLLVP